MSCSRVTHPCVQVCWSCLIMVHLEPVGGSSPKFPAESSISNLARRSFSSLNLVCPALGSPAPAFRFVISFSDNYLRACWRLCTKVPWWKHSKSGQKSLNIYGTFLPSSGLAHSSIQVCQGGLKTFIPEPVGGSSPKFSLLSKSFELEMPYSHPFSLSCPAQGSPVPSYRSVARHI